SEWYQVSLGGRQGHDASLGKVIGPSFAQDDVPGVVRQIIEVFVEHRQGDERFLDVFDRVGMEPFKSRIYQKERAHG
ncbi:MAG: nitrite/sulfite reductase, partial [Chitinimonas sp.]|nr:nitrite/sulfite reductase [Chitinimonas sp.]